MNCGSSLRLRSIIDLLVYKIYGKHKILSNIKANKNIKGIGFSDFYIYAEKLKVKFDYINTFYHKEPMLDLLNIPDNEIGKYDFIINSEVLEHIHQPIERAFENMYRLLKPGGICIFTVPYTLKNNTVEHFPALNDYKIEQLDDHYYLTNITLEENEERFDNLIFHGGRGSTLELRVFCKDHVHALLKEAGFHDIEFYRKNVYRFGIIWQYKWSLPIFAQKPL